MVIGGGPGVTPPHCMARWPGLSVAVIEFDKVGGTCLHRGCIPAKQFLETASVFRTVAGSAEFGVNSGTGSDSSPVVDFAVSQGRKQKVVNQLFKGLSGLMKGRGITVFAGTGTLLADHRVRIDGNDGSTTEIHGTDVILAAGSVPRTIPHFEVDGTLVMTSDEVLDLKELPGSVAVIGGGAIGCEFASMLSDLGSKVTVLEALPAILNGCDEDVAAVVSRSFRKRGIEVKVGVQIHGHTPNRVRRGHGDLLWRRRDRFRWTPSSSRWVAGRGPRDCSRRDPVSSSTNAVSWRPTRTCAPPLPGCGPWATWWPARPSSPTWGSPKPSW